MYIIQGSCIYLDVQGDRGVFSRNGDSTFSTSALHYKAGTEIIQSELGNISLDSEEAIYDEVWDKV